MARMLDVYLHGHLVVYLIQDDGGQESFEYLESWLAQPGAAALSQSLPLRAKSVSRRRNAGDFSAASCRKRANNLGVDTSEQMTIEVASQVKKR
jgi:hypothetical protein